MKSIRNYVDNYTTSIIVGIIIYYFTNKYGVNVGLSFVCALLVYCHLHKG